MTPIEMTPIEEECRWRIVYAYVMWRLSTQQRPVGMVAYLRALGLDL